MMSALFLYSMMPVRIILIMQMTGVDKLLIHIQSATITVAFFLATKYERT